MGYHLTYELQTVKFVKSRAKREWHRYLLVIAVLVIGTVVLHFSTAILETVLMGQGNMAKEAAEQMVESIRGGASLSEAVQAFCLELVP